MERAMPASFVCPRCGRESFNLNDIAERYCGACHVFVDDPPLSLADRNSDGVVIKLVGDPVDDDLQFRGRLFNLFNGEGSS